MRKKGGTWRVKNGRKVQIWNHNLESILTFVELLYFFWSFQDAYLRHFK